METTILHFSEELRFTDDEFYNFCQQNSALKFERTKNGDIIFMANTGGKTGILNTEVLTDVNIWNRKTKFGVVFDSSTAFRLPDTSVKSPDVAVVEMSKWSALTEEEKEKFVPLCPDFVIEILSPSDKIKDAQQKMIEWMENGCLLAWLIDLKNELVYIYQENQDVSEIKGFQNHQITGEAVLPEFTLDLKILL